MPDLIPAPPAFGAPCPITPSPETLALLAGRRSSSAALLTAPGPDRGQVEALLTLAARVPDHGKLSPWRFIVLQGAAKAALVAELKRIAAERGQPERALVKLAEPPVSVAVVSRPQPAAAIPVWEQQMSAGAVCMTLLIAAQAMGFGANWITDWYSTEPDALAALGLGEGEKIAGFIHFGTPAEPPQERARPDLNALTTWRV